MKNRNRFRAFHLLLLSGILASGCHKTSKVIDFGSFKNGTYTNDFFNLTVYIPESWYVLDDESRIEFMRQGNKLIAGKDENLNAVLEAVELQNLNLLTASEYPPGAPVSSNSNLVLMAEKVKHLPGIVRGRDYHFHTKKLLQSSAVQMEYPNEIYEQIIDGVAFDVLDIEIKIGNQMIRQKQYVTIMNGYALAFGMTYLDAEGLKKLEDIIHRVDFN